MRILGIVALGAALGGCATAPQMIWLRVDGQRPSDTPVNLTQYEVDSTACLGERGKANLSGVTFTGGGLAGIAAAQNRSNAADTVQRGCMAEKGYLLVPEDQAAQKQAELAAVTEQKRQQEAAATAPPPKPRKPPPKPAPPATQ
jgi:hypothetical protein